MACHEMMRENKKKEPWHKADISDRLDLLVAGSLLGCLMVFFLFPLIGVSFLWLFAVSLSGFGNDVPPETALSENEVTTALNKIEQQQVQEFLNSGKFSSELKFPPASRSCTDGHSLISEDGRSITNLAQPASCLYKNYYSNFISRIFVISQEQGDEPKLVRVRCISDDYPDDLTEYGERYMPKLIQGKFPVCPDADRAWSALDPNPPVFPILKDYSVLPKGGYLGGKEEIVQQLIETSDQQISDYRRIGKYKTAIIPKTSCGSYTSQVQEGGRTVINTLIPAAFCTNRYDRYENYDFSNARFVSAVFSQPDTNGEMRLFQIVCEYHDFHSFSSVADEKHERVGVVNDKPDCQAEPPPGIRIVKELLVEEHR